MHVALSGFLEVPQKSVSDYIFTTPLLTNDINGTVIDPYSPYGVIRSEDVDWFREAFQERICLMVGHISKKLGVGAQIIRPNFDVFWNGPVRNDVNGWLDPSVTLLRSPRLIDIGKLDESVTNIFEEAFMTNAVTNSFSIISMPMTNGTASVFTNKWSARVLSDSGMRKVTTNVVTKSLIDFCCEEVDVFPGYVKTPDKPFGIVSTSNGTTGLRSTYFFNPGVFTNASEALQGTKRLADENKNPTNSVMLVFEQVVDGDDGWEYSRDEGLVSQCIYYVYTIKDQATRRRTQNYTAIIPTKFHDHIATTGNINRVSLEAVYALCSFEYVHVKDNEIVTSVDTNVLLKISGSLDTSGENALVKVPLNSQSLCSDAASCAGCPAAPGLSDHREEDYGDGSSWYFSISEFIMFYAITPGTVLPIWK